MDVYRQKHDAAEARKQFEKFAANDFRDLPRDRYWLYGMSFLSEVCAYLGDVPRAAILYELLRPYADRYATVAIVVNSGSVSRYLGLLAATLSRWEEAEKHFNSALEMDASFGSRPWVAHTRHDYAAMLLSRNARGDRERALGLVTQALATAQELGMKALLEEALALKLRIQGIDASETRTSIDAVVAAVERERPDLRLHASPDGTVTIMFSDIENSTIMTERLGDRRWLEVLHDHNAIVREQVAAHGGFEVKTQGDGFMVVFQSARQALHCATAMQRALAAYSETHRDEPLRIRIGLHTGEAIKESEDFYGKNVILAARIAAQALGKQILLSSLVKSVTESAREFTFEDERQIQLKGLSGTYGVVELKW